MNPRFTVAVLLLIAIGGITLSEVMARDLPAVFQHREVDDTILPDGRGYYVIFQEKPFRYYGPSALGGKQSYRI